MFPNFPVMDINRNAIWHHPEKVPQDAIIVTNLGTSSRAVVRFYNKRGTAEQWIKEGKQAVAMTPAFLSSLSGQRGATVVERHRL